MWLSPLDWKVAAPAGAVAVLAAGLVLVTIPKQGGDDSPFQSTTAQPSPTEIQSLHVNESGGFQFKHSPAWIVEDEGGVSTARRLDGRISISFRAGAAEGLLSISAAEIRRLRDRFPVVRPRGARSVVVSAQVGIVRRGVVRDAEGRRLRFRSLVLGGEGVNHVALALADADLRNTELSAAIWEVLRSFGRLGSSDRSG